MARKPNDIKRFWHELKRRNVIQVITAYAAVSFIILQLLDIVAQPLRLPEWTLQSLIILLCIGFVIVVLFSWIYDITSGGVKKTKSLKSIKSDKESHISETSNSWKIISYVSITMIFVLIAFNIFSKNKSEDFSKLEKSIAVLPFINDSPSDSNQYFINGLMEEVLNNLQKIKDFRVLSRTSTDQYKGIDRPTIPEIAKKLNVSYIVEGSGQKYGNSYRLRIQLIAGNNERHLWAESYEKGIRETNDIYSTQSEIAQSIASALKATITPEEKQLIEKIPTANLTAYDFYQRGKDELTHYWMNNDDTTALVKAEDFYRKALKHDSTFALAYTGLARIYWNKHYWASILSVNFLDSVPVLGNIALFYDKKLSNAYTLMGDYYQELVKHKQAIEEYNKAISFNPNDWRAFYGRGGVYYNYDLVKCLEDSQKAVSLNHGPELPSLLHNLSVAYSNAGFIEKAKYYGLEALKLDRDSLSYYSKIYSISDFESSHYVLKIVKLLEKEYSKDSSNLRNLYDLGLNYVFLHQPEKALKCFKKYFQKNQSL